MKNNKVALGDEVMDLVNGGLKLSLNQDFGEVENDTLDFEPNLMITQ